MGDFNVGYLGIAPIHGRLASDHELGSEILPNIVVHSTDYDVAVQEPYLRPQESAIVKLSTDMFVSERSTNHNFPINDAADDFHLRFV